MQLGIINLHINARFGGAGGGARTHTGRGPRDFHTSYGFRRRPRVKVDPELLPLGREVRPRKERGLSQEALADLAGLHTNYVGGIERGERNVGVKALFALARGLSTEPAALFNPPPDGK